MAKKLSILLYERLVRLGFIDKGLTIRRIIRGRSGKAAGTWAWEIYNAQGIAARIGSEDTMKECVGASRLSSYRDIASHSLQICAEE